MLVDFHSVFDRHSGDVYRFALYLSGDPSLAEEITQETFVRAWVVPGEITGGTVKAYLLTIARNLYCAERRRRTRESALDGTVADRQTASLTTARRQSDCDTDLDAVLKALQSLPEVDRAALLMHAQDGLPHAAIATVLGLSITAVKVRIHRARIKLRAMCDTKEETP
jgi:RNA polymerase sigma-70 factor, ECF subfamily